MWMQITNRKYLLKVSGCTDANMLNRANVVLHIERLALVKLLNVVMTDRHIIVSDKHRNKWSEDISNCFSQRLEIESRTHGIGI